MSEINGSRTSEAPIGLSRRQWHVTATALTADTQSAGNKSNQ